MLLARLPEAIICGLIPPGEDAKPIFFPLNPLTIIPLTGCPPQCPLFAWQESDVESETSMGESKISFTLEGLCDHMGTRTACPVCHWSILFMCCLLKGLMFSAANGAFAELPQVITSISWVV